MSIATNPSARPKRPTPVAAAPPSDAQLVEQTQAEIRALVREIEVLAASDRTPAEFHAGFLARVVTALAASSGAIWVKQPGGELALAYQVNLPPQALTESHAKLVRQAWENPAPQLVPPRAEQANSAGGNPTDQLLLFAPLAVEGQTLALVEIFQRPGGGPAAQRGYLRFLAQMCAHGVAFMQGRRVRQLQDRQAMWDDFDQFLRELHRKLDVRHVALTIANDGRKLCGGDRVSVLIGTKRPRLIAASGSDTLERRAAQIRGLETLAAQTITAGEALWSTGDETEREATLAAYAAQAQSRAIAIVPLLTPSNKPLGVLVVERWEAAPWPAALRERIATVAAHSATALASAQEHHAIFLAPLWKALGSGAWLARVPKVLLLATLITAIAAALVLVPADFRLAARGKLQPVERRDIFAPVDGVVVDVPFDHADFVQPGEALATLRNTDLDVQIAALLGRQTSLTEQLSTAQRALLHESQLSVEEQNRIAGEIAELKQALAGLARELDLYAHKQQQLVVRSDRAAQVVTWHARELLLSRPVQRGQVLLTVANPDGDWELELDLPEKRLGHALAAQSSGRPLAVRFQLSTHPGQEFRGEVIEIERRAVPRGETGNIVTVRVAIDKTQLPELHSETTVTAQLECGRRALGYVLFQDAVEGAQRQAMLWW